MAKRKLTSFENLLNKIVWALVPLLVLLMLSKQHDVLAVNVRLIWILGTIAFLSAVILAILVQRKEP